MERQKGPNEKCEKCPDLVRSRRAPTWGYGNPKAKVMFIGEAPGRFGCDITGIPFTGDRSGELFQQVLREARIDFGEVYTTNIVKCCPYHNRTPESEEINTCASYLLGEIEEIDPLLIVALGATASRYFDPEVSVVRNWGKYAHYGNINVMVLPHPAFILRDRDKWYQKYLSSFRKIKAIIDVDKQTKMSKWTQVWLE